MARKDHRQWLDDGLRGLTAIAKKSLHVNPDVVEPVGAWTLLKQVTIYKSLGIYLPLMAKRPWRKVYIDTHSSCGINLLEETQERVAGSALIAADARTRFDHYYFVETDTRKRDALSKRLPYYLPQGKFTVIPNPAEVAVREIQDREGRREIHYFAVVDPYKLSQMTWAGFEELMSTSRGDLLINFPTTEVKRHPEPTTVARFIGDDQRVRELFDQDAPEDEFLRLFVSRVAVRRPRIVTIRVKSGAGRYGYDLIYAAADTGGGSPWVKGIHEIKARVESLDGSIALETRKSRRLDAFRGEGGR